MKVADATLIANRKGGISWAMFATLALAILLPLYFLGYTVIYTGSEVTRDFFVILTFALTGSAALLSFYSRRSAAFLLIGAGGLLLIWQTREVRKWAMIHEDVAGIIQHVEKIRETTGSYPASLQGYTFRNFDLKRHFDSGYRTENQEFRLSYFMSNPGTAYWYDSKSGFHYYAD